MIRNCFLRWTLRAFGLLLLVLILLVVGLYFYASAAPEGYEPVTLSQAQRKAAAKQFASRVQEFSNEAQKPQVFTWSITQRQINGYLESMDEIAAQMPGGREGQVRQALDRVGLSDPAVRLEDGVITFMFRFGEYDKVVSADMMFVFPSAGRMSLQLEQVRVGRLPLPEAVIGDKIHRLKKLLERSLQKAEPSGGPNPMGLSSDDFAAGTVALVQAMDGTPVSTEFTWPVGEKRVRVREIRIDSGRLTLLVEPAGKG